MTRFKVLRGHGGLWTFNGLTNEALFEAVVHLRPPQTKTVFRTDPLSTLMAYGGYTQRKRLNKWEMLLFSRIIWEK